MVYGLFMFLWMELSDKAVVAAYLVRPEEAAGAG
jgi:hypothetical protein